MQETIDFKWLIEVKTLRKFFAGASLISPILGNELNYIARTHKYDHRMLLIRD